MYYINSRHLRQGHGDESSSDEDEPPAAIANADEGADADMSDDEVSHQGRVFAIVWSVGRHGLPAVCQKITAGRQCQGLLDSTLGMSG